MKHITKKQLPQVSSIAYILFDLFKKGSDKKSYIYKWLDAGTFEPLKKNTAKNIIAKALGYTSWSHLNMASRKNIISKSNNKSDYVTIFDNVDQCISFLEKELKRYNFNQYVIKRIADEITFDYSKNEYPFISEFLAAYEFECDIIGDDNYYTIFFKGDRSVGIQSHYTNIRFKTKKEIDDFFQTNIEIIRSEYVELENIDKVIDALEKRFNELSN